MSQDNLKVGNVCGVCFQEIPQVWGVRGEVELRCGHIFHTICIDRQLQENYDCSVCRTITAFRASQEQVREERIVIVARKL